MRLSPQYLFLICLALPCLSQAQFDLDVDDDGETRALTDGLLIIRYMFGFRSEEGLILDNVAVGAKRSEAAQIAEYLSANLPSLDVDGDEKVKALTDGLLIVRSLLGFTDNALTDGAISSGAPRFDATDIRNFLSTITDSDNDDVLDNEDAYPLDASRDKSDLWGEALWGEFKWFDADSNAI